MCLMEVKDRVLAQIHETPDPWLYRNGKVKGSMAVAYIL